MTVALLGDIMLGRLVNECLREDVPPTYPWGDVLPVLQQTDLRLGNLECVLSDRGEPWSQTPKAFHFRSDAKNIAVLQAARLDAVSLANNHSLDFGHEALIDTLDLLDAAGIARAGAGRNREEAARPALLVRAGRRLGLLAFTDNEPDWEATPTRPGVYYVPVATNDARFRELLERVHSARAGVDLLIVSAHWGPNWGTEPGPSHMPCAHALIDAGADVVYGHSCHVVRGAEFYNRKPILHSTGDFVDDYAVDPVEHNDQSFIFLLDLHNSEVLGLRLVPTRIHRYQALLAREDEGRQIAERMHRLCAGLGTAAEWDPRARCLRVTPPPA